MKLKVDMLIPMKHNVEDIESYETKNSGCWVLWNIKKRMWSPIKHKVEDVESYETKNRGHLVLWNIK